MKVYSKNKCERCRLTFYTFFVGVGGSNFGVAFEEPAAVVVAITFTSLISKGLILLEFLSSVGGRVYSFST